MKRIWLIILGGILCLPALSILGFMIYSAAASIIDGFTLPSLKNLFLTGALLIVIFAVFITFKLGIKLISKNWRS